MSALERWRALLAAGLLGFFAFRWGRLLWNMIPFTRSGLGYEPTAESLIEQNAVEGWAAESSRYRVGLDWEFVYLLRGDEKPVRIGAFLGGINSAAIDPAERWVVMVGLGLIAYRLAEPFEQYPDAGLDGFITSYVSDQWWDWGRSLESPTLRSVEYLDSDRFRLKEDIDPAHWQRALIDELIAPTVASGGDWVAARGWWGKELNQQAEERGIDLRELAIGPQDAVAIVRLVDAGTPLIDAIAASSPSPNAAEPRVFILHAEKHKVIEQPKAQPASQ